MEKTVKLKKRAGQKVFSIIAAVTLILVVVARALLFVGDFATRVILTFVQNQTLNLPTIMLYLADNTGLFLFITLAVVTIVMLFVNKNDFFLFIPVGLLTYSCFAPALSTVVTWFLHQFAVGGIAFNTIAALIHLAVSMVPALMLTVIICICAVTFCRKCRFVPMFFLTVVFVCGIVMSIISTGFIIVNNLFVHTEILENMDQISAIVFLYDNTVAPIIGIFLSAVTALAILFIAIGMCFRPKLVAKVKAETVEEAAFEAAPVEAAPVEEAPVEEAPVEEAPVEEAPVEEAPESCSESDSTVKENENG